MRLRCGPCSHTQAGERNGEWAECRWPRRHRASGHYLPHEWVSIRQQDGLCGLQSVTGKFNAAQVEDGTQALKPYSVRAGNGTGSALLFCLMPVLNEDDEFRQKFQEFVSLLESGWADMDAAFECALSLCDNVYRRIENSKQLGTDGVKISIPYDWQYLSHYTDGNG